MGKNSTIGVTELAAEMLEMLHKKQGGQKRDLATDIIIGVLTSDKDVYEKIMQQGKLARLALETGALMTLNSGVVFPAGHPFENNAVTLTLEKFAVNGQESEK